MRLWNAFWSTAMSRGRISPGWDRILTGLAMLLVAWMLWPAAVEDSAAGPASAVLAIVGVVCVAVGIRAER